jgi:hypothetical protein
MKQIDQFISESFSPNMDRYSQEEQKEFINKIKDFFERNAQETSSEGEIKDNVAACNKVLDDTLKTYSGRLNNVHLTKYAIHSTNSSKFPSDTYDACILICVQHKYYDAKLINSNKILDVVILTNDHTYYIGGMSAYTELNAYKSDHFSLTDFVSFMCKELGCYKYALHGT